MPLGILAWNSRAAYPAIHNSKKADYRNKLLKKYGISIFCESHGHSQTIRYELGKLGIRQFAHSPAYKLDASQQIIENTAAGGIIVSIANSLAFQLCAPIQQHIFVDGYAMRVSLFFRQGKVVIYALHLTSLTQEQLDSIAEALSNDIRQARLQGPNNLVIAGGDIDFRFPGDETFRLDSYGNSGRGLQDGVDRAGVFNGSIIRKNQTIHAALMELTEVSDLRPTF